MSEESNEIYELAAKVARGGEKGTPMEKIQGFPLESAYLCNNCDTVTNNPASCPMCAGTSLSSLAKWLGTNSPELDF